MLEPTKKKVVAFEQANCKDFRFQMERWPDYTALLNSGSEVPGATMFSFQPRGCTGKPLKAYPMSYQNQYGTTMVRVTDMQNPIAKYNPLRGPETFDPFFNWLPAKYIGRRE